VLHTNEARSSGEEGVRGDAILCAACMNEEYHRVMSQVRIGDITEACHMYE